MIRSFAIAGSFALTLALCGHAEAGEAGTRHAAWQGCLNSNFGIQSRLTGRMLAADAALRACREAEQAYLDALASSPLVDAEEAVQARPALVARARGWLLGRRASL
ncbi:hypothetical protein [Methylobacterium dankookense]|uniref:Lysozyme inhibitor LprI N-terminal domain-containing protein n=1 Tax=Methylobacterium dankookense TaxID=560405 RepID=A0A564FU69_9HYPH|nr:hypothetical protein [Methylobacterium dankookense]VUF11338.1 hypothetical protein MTDSW087_01019 [Methylobacterium dankookense]